MLEYVTCQLGQQVLLMNTIALSYPTLSARWFEWGTVLASLQHQMEAQSVSLCSMATRASKVMGDLPLTSKEALVKYCELREVKNDTPDTLYTTPRPTSEGTGGAVLR